MPSIINRAAVVQKPGEGGGEDPITDGTEEAVEIKSEDEDDSDETSA